MRLTKAQQKIVDDAKAAGYIVTEKPTYIDINVSKRGVGVRMWEDGSITRNDVSLELATNFKSQREVRKFLKLSSDTGIPSLSPPSFSTKVPSRRRKNLGDMRKQLCLDKECREKKWKKHVASQLIRLAKAVLATDTFDA